MKFLSITQSLFVLLSFNNLSAQASEFVLAPAPIETKNMGCNALKEQIGKTTKEVFDGTTLAGTYVGKSHCALSSLQKNMADGAHDQAALKQMLQASAGYTSVLGTIQQKLSQHQQKCALIIEKLIDNQAPFKKASKKMLSDSLAILHQGKQRVSTCSKTLLTINADMKKSAIKSLPLIEKIQDATKKLQDQVALLEGTVTLLTTDECLKNA